MRHALLASLVLALLAAVSRGASAPGPKPGQAADASPKDDGYVHLQRRWQAGDVVELDLPMPVRRVYAHEKVLEDKGKVALMRGPILYCLEAVDNPGVDVFRMALPRETVLRAEHRAELLVATGDSTGRGGVTVLQGQALADAERPVTLTAVPYYAWANREKGPMTVWLDEAPVKASPSTQ
ncbi:MAG: hypothetical protein WBD75_05910 [Phycisphaerae bacterium]